MAPVVALLAGAELALRSGTARPLLAVALVAGGLALWGRSGAVVCSVAVGLLTVWVRPAPSLGEFDRARPLEFEATLAAPWQRSGQGWSGPVRLHRVAQGRVVRLDHSRLWLGLPGADRPPGGRRIRARGFLRFAHPAANGNAVRPPLPRVWLRSRRLLELRSDRRGLEARARAAWDRTLGSGEAPNNGVALARALVLGERGGLSRRFEQGLRRAGLGHLLALSGLHVGILAAAGLGAGRLLGGCLRGRYWRWLPPLACACGYLLVVGPRPAIVRASLMAVLAWAALARGSSAMRWNTLALVAGGMVLCTPRLLRDLGFQLTVAATAGILFAGLTNGGCEPAGGRVQAALRVSVAAQVFTLPWALPAFHLLAPAAPLHNLWAVPWTGFALFAGLAWTLVALASPRAAAFGAGILELGSWPFEAISRARAGPLWSLPVALSPLRAAAVSLGAATALRRPIVAAALLSGLSLLAGTSGGPEPELPELSMLDVGQGEALLLRDGGTAVLVDGGGWSGGDLGARVLVPALAGLGVRRLQALVLTHPDLDHCRGLADIAAYLPVRELWTPAGWAPRPCVLALLSLPGVRWRPLWEGKGRSVGRWRLEVLHPVAGDRTEGNDRSLVLRAEVHGFRALLTGDVERAAELSLLDRKPAAELRADLLKIPHHGSRTSSGEALLDAVAPRLAWISAGRSNRYGHPAREVLERLRGRRIRVLRTDRDGMLVLRIAPTGQVHFSMPGAPAWAPAEPRLRSR